MAFLEKTMIQKKSEILILTFTLTLLVLGSCTKKDSLERIKETGQITVLTRNNGHCYYTYRDKSMGFEYELAKAFADLLGVDLNIVTPKWDELINLLNDGEGDLIAASMTITPSREEQADFSDGYMTIQQQVIVHKANHEVKKIDDLQRRTVHVRSGTSYEERLKELNAEGLDINIILHDDVPTEELIRKVHGREVEITIADSNIALLNRRYYPDIKIAFPIAEPQMIGWALRKNEQALLSKINEFFKTIEEDGTFGKIYHNNYANVEIFDYVDMVKFHHRLQTRLPKYKDIIRQSAKKNGFDWKLIAAIVYQESHFNPKAKSYTGVRGLMQLTQETAKEMGIKNRLDPVQSIFGGVKYLKKIYMKHDDIKDPDRLLVSLASYNVGHGHVVDAQRIAKKMGLDSKSWSALEKTLPLLRYPKYYKKSNHGYCRGTEPVRYVNRILTYYDILKKAENI